jgi:general secretion pathway protein K
MRRGILRRMQRGAALLLAMIIVALVATVTAGMVWQQNRAVQVEAAERARARPRGSSVARWTGRG